MTKVLKYLKKYWVLILMITGLLFLNAQAELALPDYMSTIINTGIQNGGVEDSVMSVISDTTYQQITIFMDESDKEYVDTMYELTAFDDLTIKQQKQYPDASSLYVLKSHSNSERETLKQIFQEPLFFTYVFKNIENYEQLSEEGKEFLSQFPEGMSIFDVLSMMPKEQIDDILDEMLVTVRAMGSTALDVVNATAIKSEYASLGRDVDQMQLTYIAQIGLLMLAVALVGSIASIMVGFLSARIGGDLSRRLRKDTFEKIQHFSISEFNNFSTASLITRTTNDIQQIQNVVTMCLRIVIYAPIMGIGALIKVMNSSANMSWIIALTIAILLFVIIIVFMIVLPKFKIVQKLVDRLNLVMRENLSGMLVIRAFGKEKTRQETFEKANRDITDLNMFVNRVMNVIMPMMNFILSCIMLLIVWVGAKNIDLGTLNIGDMMAFMQYSMQIIMAFIMIAMIFVMIPRASVAATRVFEVLETNVSIIDPQNPKTFDEDKKGFVEFKNVEFSYPGAEEAVLHDINFTAKPGQMTAFIGSTGSGKSTLINLIMRFYDVSGGQIVIDGVNIKEVTQKELRQKIGLVPQANTLFKGTIASNLRFGDKNATIEDLKKASAIAQATEFIESKEDGYDALIAQGGTNVSGGQKQRISIARAITKKPEIYIFDDSFSALDFKTDAALRAAMNQLLKETDSTMLLVGQRISSIMNAEQIIVLDNGRIVGKGTHKELLTTCEVYKEIAYSQLSKEELENDE